jgi:hypothetical protein
MNRNSNLHVDVVRETTAPHCQIYQRLRNQLVGLPPILEDGNVSANVSINNNDDDEFTEGVSDERQAKKKI